MIDALLIQPGMLAKRLAGSAGSISEILARAGLISRSQLLNGPR